MPMLVAGYGEGHASAPAGGVSPAAAGMPSCLEHIVRSCFQPSPGAVL